MPLIRRYIHVLIVYTLHATEMKLPSDAVVVFVVVVVVVVV